MCKIVQLIDNNKFEFFLSGYFHNIATKIILCIVKTTALYHVVNVVTFERNV